MSTKWHGITVNYEFHGITNVVVDGHLFPPPPPINLLFFTTTYLRPDSSDHRLTLFVRLGGWGVGVVTTNPSHTTTSDVVTVISFPTNMTDSSDTTSCAAPVSLSI